MLTVDEEKLINQCINDFLKESKSIDVLNLKLKKSLLKKALFCIIHKLIYYFKSKTVGFLHKKRENFHVMLVSKRLYFFKKGG